MTDRLAWDWMKTESWYAFAYDESVVYNVT